MKMLVFAVQFSRGTCRPLGPATAWVGPWNGINAAAVACGPMAPPTLEAQAVGPVR